MSHPIYPSDRDGSGSTDGLRSCASEAIPVNDLDLIAIKPDPTFSELPDSTEFTASTMSLAVLAEHCLSEINRYRVGGTHSDTYFVELLRRATLQGNQDAREILQRCLSITIREWLANHPIKELLYQQESEGEYMAEAFSRFYEALLERKVELNRLSIALRYLQVCLNSTLLDKLRASTRPREILLWETMNSEESAEVDLANDEYWEMLRKILPNVCAQHLAYLLFHCALKPGEIIHLLPQEFQDEQEISRLRRSIINLLLDYMDQ